MQVSSDTKERHVLIRLENAAEEACYVYDLVQSGRLLVQNREHLPLPFRGQFLFKLADWPRPLEIQVGRFEASATERAEGQGVLRLVVHCPGTGAELLAELETALREVPPASEEEFKVDPADRTDEFTRVRRMTFARKVIYATRAGQTGRAILMQQPTPLLLLYLTKNPLITLPELIAIAKMPSIDSLVAESMVRMLRSSPQLAMCEELKVALATNVKTPPGTAISLLSHLNSKSLRRIAKCDVSGSVKNAAVKILLDRRD